MGDDIINGYDLFWDDLYKLQPKERLDRVIEMSKDEDGEQKMEALKEYFIDALKNESREEWWYEDFVEIMCWMIEEGHTNAVEMDLSDSDKENIKAFYFENFEINEDRKEEARLLGIDIGNIEDAEIIEVGEGIGGEPELIGEKGKQLTPKQEILRNLNRSIRSK